MQYFINNSNTETKWDNLSLEIRELVLPIENILTSLGWEGGRIYWSEDGLYLSLPRFDRSQWLPQNKASLPSYLWEALVANHSPMFTPWEAKHSEWYRALWRYTRCLEVAKAFQANWWTQEAATLLKQELEHKCKILLEKDPR